MLRFPFLFSLSLSLQISGKQCHHSSFSIRNHLQCMIHSLFHYTWFLRFIWLISALFAIPFDLSSGCSPFVSFTLHGLRLAAFFYDWNIQIQDTQNLLYLSLPNFFFRFRSFVRHSSGIIDALGKHVYAMDEGAVEKKKCWLSFIQTIFFHSSCSPRLTSVDRKGVKMKIYVE